MICVQSAPSIELLIDSVCCYFEKQLSERLPTFAYTLDDNNSIPLFANALCRIVINNSLFKYFCAWITHINHFYPHLESYSLSLSVYSFKSGFPDFSSVVLSP